MQLVPTSRNEDLVVARRQRSATFTRRRNRRALRDLAKSREDAIEADDRRERVAGAILSVKVLVGGDVRARANEPLHMVELGAAATNVAALDGRMEKRLDGLEDRCRLPTSGDDAVDCSVLNVDLRDDQAVFEKQAQWFLTIVATNLQRKLERRHDRGVAHVGLGIEVCRRERGGVGGRRLFDRPRITWRAGWPARTVKADRRIERNGDLRIIRGSSITLKPKECARDSISQVLIELVFRNQCSYTQGAEALELSDGPGRCVVTSSIAITSRWRLCVIDDGSPARIGRSTQAGASPIEIELATREASIETEVDVAEREDVVFVDVVVGDVGTLKRGERRARGRKLSFRLRSGGRRLLLVHRACLDSSHAPLFDSREKLAGRDERDQRADHDQNLCAECFSRLHVRARKTAEPV
jgi:hypothetical protein